MIMAYKDPEQVKKYGKAYREANRAKISARRKAWREANSTREKEKAKAYNTKNKDLIAAQKHEYYLANKERINVRNKEYAQKNPKVMAKACKKWREKNPEKARDALYSWRNSNRGFYNAYQRTYNKSNTEYINFISAKRHAAKVNRTPSWLTEDDFWLMQEAYNLAALRTKMFGFPWHVDHIIPLQGKTVSGLHVPKNLQVIPGVENLRKSNKYGVYDAE